MKLRGHLTNTKKEYLVSFWASTPSFSAGEKAKQNNIRFLFQEE